MKNIDKCLTDIRIQCYVKHGSIRNAAKVVGCTEQHLGAVLRKKYHLTNDVANVFGWEIIITETAKRKK